MTSDGGGGERHAMDAAALDPDRARPRCRRARSGVSARGVTFADVGPSKIPEWMEEEDAVLLTDACPTGNFGAQLGEIKESGCRRCVGAGRFGLFAAKSAWLMAAGRVSVWTRSTSEAISLNTGGGSSQDTSIATAVMRSESHSWV